MKALLIMALVAQAACASQATAFHYYRIKPTELQQVWAMDTIDNYLGHDLREGGPGGFVGDEFEDWCSTDEAMDAGDPRIDDACEIMETFNEDPS